jgi:hypothetical protein
VFVVPGNGDGTFQTPIPTPVPNVGQELGIGDFNGDGIPDLVATVMDAGSGNVYLDVFISNGDGTFAESHAASVGSNGVEQMATGDFNGDGKLDIAAESWWDSSGASTMYIAMGNGDGTFQPAQQYNVGNYAGSFAAGDFNGDGKLDLAVPNQGPSAIIMLYGNGDGTFQAAQPIPGSNTLSPAAAATGKFTGDGSDGLVFGDWFSPSVFVFLHSSSITATTTNIPLSGTAGTHTIQATYTPDGSASYLGSSGTVDVTVTVPATVTAVSLTAPSSMTLGDSTATATATLTESGGNEPPTGTVSIIADSSTTLYTGSASQGNVISVGLNSLSVGTHTLEAQYSDGNGTITSNTVTVTVNKATPTITISWSAGQPGPLVYGYKAPSIKAVTTTPAGTPMMTGSAKIYSDSTLIATLASLHAGTTTISGLTGIPVGTDNVTIQWPGDANFNAANSNAIQLTVTPAVSSTTTLSTSAAEIMYPDQVTFTAVVTIPTDAAFAPRVTGTVAFMDGSTSLGTGTLAYNGTSKQFQTLLPVSALKGGAHTITASYSGDTNVPSSISAPLTETVDKVGSSTALLVSPQTVNMGGTVSLTATVTGAAGGATPIGNIVFLDGSNAVATVPVDGSGMAATSVTSLTAGTHSLVATYQGNESYLTSSSTANANSTVTVNKLDGAGLALASSANPSKLNQSITISVTVTGSGATPSGNVTLTEGSTAVGTAPVNASGVATFPLSNLTVGTHNLVASYAGDSVYNAAGPSAPLVQTVNRLDSATALQTSAAKIPAGSQLTLTASVSGSGATPSGNVNFVADGSTSLGTGTLNASGAAFITVATLSVGNHSVVASYVGDTGYNASSSAASPVEVDKLTPNVAVTSSSNPSKPNQSITISVTVTGSGATPSGNVTVTEGNTALGTSPVNGSGIATFPLSNLTVGTHNLDASYAGDSVYNGGSAALTQSVEHLDSATALAVNPSVANVGGTVSLTATVSGSGATPTGNVTFVADGSTSLGVGTLNASGVASISLSSLGSGSHSVVANYGGDTVYNSSTSSPAGVTVNKLAPNVGISSTPNPSKTTDAVTILVTVTVSGPTPTGNVTLLEGSTAVGTAPVNASGVATFPLSNLTVGTHSLVASYAGDTVYNSGSAALTQTVNPAGALDFELDFTSIGGAVPFGSGQSWSSAILVKGVNGFTGTVTLTCSGLAPTLGCNFASPQVVAAEAGTKTAVTVTTAGRTILTAGMLGIVGLCIPRKKRHAKTKYVLAIIGTLALAFGMVACGGGSMRYTQNDGTPKGTYSIVVTGTSGNITHSQTVTVTVR